MTASITLPDTNVTVMRFPASTSSGLWNALAASTSQSSAAGSRPAESTALGRPVSLVLDGDRSGDGETGELATVVDMFAFRSPDPAPAA